MRILNGEREHGLNLGQWLEYSAISGFEELINDPNDALETRIDHIFLEPYNLELEKSRGEVVGDKATDMVPNSNDPGHYLWPSDHAGVVTNLKFEEP